MDHTLLTDIPVESLADGLRWEFFVPETSEDGTVISFDLNEVTEAEVFVYDISQGGLLYQKIIPVNISYSGDS